MAVRNDSAARVQVGQSRPAWDQEGADLREEVIPARPRRGIGAARGSGLIRWGQILAELNSVKRQISLDDERLRRCAHREQPQAPSSRTLRTAESTPGPARAAEAERRRS